jgi:hypothetical protein
MMAPKSANTHIDRSALRTHLASVLLPNLLSCPASGRAQALHRNHPTTTITLSLFLCCFTLSTLPPLSSLGLLCLRHVDLGVCPPANPSMSLSPSSTFSVSVGLFSCRCIHAQPFPFTPALCLLRFSVVDLLYPRLCVLHWTLMHILQSLLVSTRAYILACAASFVLSFAPTVRRRRSRVSHPSVVILRQPTFLVSPVLPSCPAERTASAQGFFLPRPASPR